MSKLITAVLITGSLSLINYYPSQAKTNFLEVVNPNPTFPIQAEHKEEEINFR